MTTNELNQEGRVNTKKLILDLSNPEVIALAKDMGVHMQEVPEKGQPYDILGTEWQVISGIPSENMLGYMNAIKQQIQIRPGVPASWQLYLLLHETLHSLTFLGHLQFLRCEPPSDGYTITQDDEAKIDAVASLLSTILRRNGLINEDRLATLCMGLPDNPVEVL